MGKRGLIRSTATAAMSNARAGTHTKHFQSERPLFRCLLGNKTMGCSLLPGSFRPEVLKSRMSPFAAVAGF